MTIAMMASTMRAKAAAAIATIALVFVVPLTYADSALAFTTNARARFRIPDSRSTQILPSLYQSKSQVHPITRCRSRPHLPRDQTKQSNGIRSFTRLHLYRKFQDYGWDKLLPDNNTELDTVPEELKYNTSPAKGAPPGTNIAATIRSISQFPHLSADKKGIEVLRLARSAFLETQSPTSEALITPMTVHVLNFVLFPSPHIHDANDNENSEYLGIPIFGADIVSLPGNKHLVALDFQPVLPLEDDDDGDDRKEKTSLFPKQYAHLESKLQKIHSKYQKSDSDSTPPLPWGGDIPTQAKRFFSPYALWTRLGDEKAMNTVDTVVWEAFQEYTDLYMELMTAVQDDVNTGKLGVNVKADDSNSVWQGQIDYLEYRRTNDPARPMLQRLYGNEWAESVIGEVLFPDL
mmetsp:Transcript_28524/g.60191  ORF Transcript_28524/g.60191 Transcript_28524/m.60191 type:complete len:405 (-) Transcript_28524:221-1435(-)